jgi:hypothetical protein
MMETVTTHAQGTDTWKEVTNHTIISAYNPLPDTGNWHPYPGALARIEHFRALAPGWSGHHAAAIVEASRTAAIRLLEQAWGEFGSSVAEPTVIAPTSDGGVAFEWIIKNDDAETGVEVVCLPTRYEYSLRDRTTGRLGEDSEGTDLGFILHNVLKPRVAGHKVLSR